MNLTSENRERRSESVKNERNAGEEKIKSPKSAKIITVAVVIAVIVLNIAVALIADSFLWYIDMTQVRYTSGGAPMYTLSEECISLIGTDAVPMIEKVNEERKTRGEEPIKLNIIFCADKDHIENDPMMRYLNMTARSLEKEFSHAIDVKYVNIVKDPSAIQKFKTTSASTIYNSDVIVEFGSEYLVQKISAFYYQDEGENKPWAYNGEQRLSAMILSLTRAESPVCAITNNHGETIFSPDGKVKEEYSEFIKLIGGAGYKVESIDLEKDEIPENCRMMITFDPQADFKAFGTLGESGVSEIEKLDRYLEESNAFFYICNRETPYLKNLEEYLEEWGVTVERVSDASESKSNFIVRDSVNCTDVGKGDVVIGQYGQVGVAGGITRDLTNQPYPPKVLFANATSLKPSDSYIKTFVTEDEETGSEAGSYFSYYRNGVSRVMVDVFSSYDTATAYIGDEVYEIATALDPYRFMTITRESRNIQETNYTTIDQSSFVLAMSSTDFLTNGMLSSTAYGNCDIILSALRQSGTEAVPANIKLKAFYVYDIGEINNEEEFARERNTWLVCLSVIPAVICASVGAVVVIKRRFK